MHAIKIVDRIDEFTKCVVSGQFEMPTKLIGCGEIYYLFVVRYNMHTKGCWKYIYRPTLVISSHILGIEYAFE